LLLREAVVQLGANPVRVRADEGTRKHLTASVLAAAEKDLKLKIEMGEPLSGVSGVIAETPDGRRQFDNTLESRLARMRPALRAAVHRILMGEAR
jgi:vacuolar-type H+-ATPase subunit E/Vma4